MTEIRININITGLEGLATSIMALANNISAAPVAPVYRKTQRTAAEETPAEAQTSVPEHHTVTGTVPASQVFSGTRAQDGTPVQSAVPMQNTAPAQPVSTSAATYTLNDIANAAMTLMDSGRQPELVQLLAGFGVESLPALPQERYAEFAMALRGLGARI